MLVIVVSAGLAVFAGRPAVAEEPLSISGTVWDDHSADGVRQSDEPGVRGIRVALVRGSGNQVVQSATSDEAGKYRFEGLERGDYRVELQDVYHRALTFPAKVNLPPFESPVHLTTSGSGIDFGLHWLKNYPSFAGLAWVNAEPAYYADVRALIDGVDCTGPGGPLVSGLHAAWYTISVVPSVIKTGCGSYGKTIHFTINGLLANETRDWQEADLGPDTVLGELTDIVAGPAMAYFDMAVFDEHEVQTRAPGNVLTAYIDGKRCGVAEDAGTDGVLLVVLSEQSVAGCGYEGAEITFTFNSTSLVQRGIWRPGRAGTLFIPYRPGSRSQPSEPPTPILPPSVGDGGLR